MKKEKLMIQYKKTGCTLLLLGTVGMPNLVRADPPPVTVTYTVTTVAPTCTLSRADGNGSPLVLPSIRRSAFQSNNYAGQTSGKVIKLTLNNCQGIGGDQLPSVSVWGDRDGVTDPGLYRSASSQATGVGFGLTQNTNGSGSFLVAGTQTAPTIVLVPGTDGGSVPINKTIDFFVQASIANQGFSGLGSGALTAALHFDFLYK